MNLKWTEEKCRKEAKKYKSRVEFYKGSGGALNACKRRFPHILDEVFGKIGWTENELRKEAKKYKNRADFLKNNCSACAYCKRYFPYILNEVFGISIRRVDKWCEKELRKEAKKYKSRVEFYKGSGGAYNACRKNFPHILEELFGIKNWTEELCIKEAKKYKSRTEFRKGSSGAYTACLKSFPHILDEVFGSKKITLNYIDCKIFKEIEQIDLITYGYFFC